MNNVSGIFRFLLFVYRLKNIKDYQYNANVDNSFNLIVYVTDNVDENTY